MLPDDALLEVFHHCRGHKMHFYMSVWRPLVHVCKRWRRIIFASPLHLRLLLFCNYKTPARESLDIWPPLPIESSKQAPGFTEFEGVVELDRDVEIRA